MEKVFISQTVKYIGVDDREIDLFEGQYEVPNGVSYNSYVISDDKIAVMDTVDVRAIDKWAENLENALDGRQPDYLVLSHVEPDHGAGVKFFTEKYPEAKLVGNVKTFGMLAQFFGLDLTDRTVTVKEGDTLSLGRHTLTFAMAPMVHWPEVMVSYESSEKILFSADAFGKFGALDADEDWTCEARRYYINIVGKYGAQVQALLKKASNLDIKTICPLHGPVLSENLEYYIDKYNVWSSYQPENKGVMIAYASMHGNTAKAAHMLKEKLEELGEQKVAIADIARDDMAEAIEDSFRYDRLVVASPTYDGVLFPIMEDFLYHLKIKNYQNRKVAVIENGSWAPMAGKKMKEYFEGMKNITLCDTMVTIKSSLNAASVQQIEKLADELIAE
ncbi:MAG: FprA family A-type flavoprotein [Acutalibacteraceae bacterium]|nr:FprA family A-type flavoprotein [Acutalibacteraceae bacterium]